MSELRDLMQEAYIAHQNHRNERNNSVLLDKFYETQDNLWNKKFDPLQDKFYQNPLSAIDEIIDFLSIDISCHRCGYLKERFLKKFKSISLTSEQIDRLQKIALSLCQNPHYRREFAHWAKLMIKIGDKTFMEKLSNLCADKELNVQEMAKWMREKIVENRKDLAIAN
ncbi:MAG: hypothetical protein ACR2LT_02370 [Pyrinomonadaceae bacterium]